VNSFAGARAHKCLNMAKEVIKSVEPYIGKEKFPTVVPIGHNNAGKSYFVNNISLIKNVAELASSKLSKDERERWAHRFPVLSSSSGQQALTVLCTRIRPLRDPTDKTFSAKLTISNSDDIERRRVIYDKMRSENEDDPSPEAPTFKDLRQQLDDVANSCFPNMLSDPFTEIDRSTDPTGNLFDQLAQFRRKISRFESEVQKHPFLSWIIGIEIEGPFHNLRELQMDFVDVCRASLPFFRHIFSHHSVLFSNQVPGLTDSNLARKALSIDIVRTTEIVGLFGHGRVPADADFELIKECFQVSESTLPQLIFIHNPAASFFGNVSYQTILEQDKKFSLGAKTVLENCILRAINSLERRLFHRMKDRLISFLFVSQVHLHLVKGEPPNFSDSLREALASFVSQRLRPAYAFLLSVLMELKVFVLSSGRLKEATTLDLPSDFFKEASVELLVTLLDPDQLKAQMELILTVSRKERKKEIIKFLQSKCATSAVLQELLTSVCEYHRDEAALRLFIYSHLIFVDSKSLKNEGVLDLDLRSTLFDDFQAALENIDNLRQPGLGDNSTDLKERLLKKGRRSKEDADEQSAQIRNQTFAICFQQLVSGFTPPIFVLFLPFTPQKKPQEEVKRSLDGLIQASLEDLQPQFCEFIKKEYFLLLLLSLLQRYN